MATLADKLASAADDNRFFFTMAIVMALTIASGFSFQLAMGRSSFAAPAMVHVHALVFFGWTLFYVLQSGLVATGSIALHKRLGWIGAGWVAAVVLLGIYTTVVMVRRATTPFFFEPAYFLIMNVLTAVAFGGLMVAAIALRRRTDWHRRLIYCAMALLTGPAFGRLLPMPFLIPVAGWCVFATLMIFPIIGIFRDLRRSGRVHRAWLWGAGGIVATQLAIGILTYSGPGVLLYRAVTGGTAAQAVPPLSFPNPPPALRMDSSISACREYHGPHPELPLPSGDQPRLLAVSLRSVVTAVMI